MSDLEKWLLDWYEWVDRWQFDTHKIWRQNPTEVADDYLEQAKGMKLLLQMMVDSIDKRED